jgi:hypothetical protein
MGSPDNRAEPFDSKRKAQDSANWLELAFDLRLISRMFGL